MYDLTHSEFIREVNKGMIIKGSKVVSTGTSGELEARKQLLDAYTFALLIDGVRVIGVSTTTKIEDEMLVPSIKVKFLTVRDGKLFAHTDASIVSDKVLITYTGIRRDIFNWLKDSGKFVDFLVKYEYEVIDRHGDK